MSHTYKDSETGVVFLYDGGVEGGDVTIVVREGDVDQDKAYASYYVKIPADAILRFVASCYVRCRKMREIEALDYKSLLS